VIHCTSMRLTEAAAQNYGPMIPQTPQLGELLISGADQAVSPDIT
jgi:hypothetical protein